MNADKFDAILAAIQSQNERISELSQSMDKRISELTNSMNSRFAQIDKRFEQIDKRFEQIDKRFDKVDEEIKEIKIDLRDIRNEFIKPLQRWEKIKYFQLTWAWSVASMVFWAIWWFISSIFFAPLARAFFK